MRRHSDRAYEQGARIKVRLECFLSHRLKLRPDDAVEVYQADLSSEPAA